MAPKRGVRAEERARAALVAALNRRLETRRAAFRKLNGLAEQLLPAVEKLDYQALEEGAFKRVLRLLNRRCAADPERSCFQEAVQECVANKGQLPGGLRLLTPAGGGVSLEDISGGTAEEGNGPSLVPGHRVLKVNFRLQSTHASPRYAFFKSSDATYPPTLNQWGVNGSEDLQRSE